MLDFSLTCSWVTWNRLVFQSLLLNFVRVGSMRLWSTANLAPYQDNFFLWILSPMLWVFSILADGNTTIAISVGLPTPSQWFFFWSQVVYSHACTNQFPAKDLRGPLYSSPELSPFLPFLSLPSFPTSGPLSFSLLFAYIAPYLQYSVS